MGLGMKIEKKLLMVITFIGAFIVLLLAFYLTTGFQSGIKDMIGAVYFSLWITAVMGLWLYIIQPYLKGRPKKKGRTDLASEPVKPMPVQSPRSNLPLRDRIREYVAERRKEEGLPVPEPLRPSGSTTSMDAGSPSRSSSSGYAPAAASAGSTSSAVSVAGTAGDGELPLPDDFDENGSSDLFGDEFTEDEEGETSLPGIGDDEFESYDDTGGDEQPVTESGDLPDFEGDLEPDMTDSGLGDSLDDDFSDTGEDAAETDESGGLSDEGLSDFDMPLDESMMDDDLSGDGDLTDIEFEDLEPDEV